MATTGFGKILNISSTWAATATPGRSVYSAAKAGVSHLTAALAVEWAPIGIRVNALAPGFTLTPRTLALLDERPDRLDYHLERIPLGRLADAEDLAGAALFLTSGESDFITGQTLYVDGGFHVAR
jgi:NAD(P)-dependent dehydrogenase (short-subunit alcohol dehydrogenase family)